MKKCPPGRKVLRGFGKYMGKILDMLQYKIANDQIKRLFPHIPGPRDIHQGEANIPGLYLFTGPRDHSLCKIHSQNILSDLSEKRCILTRPAADLQDRIEMLSAEAAPDDIPVEIACSVFILIVGVRPLVVCILNIHALPP